MLWTTAGVAALAFLLAMEVAARRYGTAGPLTHQVRELIFPPKSGPRLYAGLALTMVVLTWRQRFVALGTALAVDVAFVLVRWAVGADPGLTDGNFGNGALWVIVGIAGIAVTRRTGAERLLLLKGVGLGLLLMAGQKAGDAWLLITSKTRETVLDEYVVTADHALGDPSWLAGRLVAATDPVSTHVLNLVYGQLPLAAAIVALYQLRHVAVERRFPSHHLVRTFLVIGLIGPGIYMIFPVVGPVYAFGADGGAWATAHLWPNALPSLDLPQPMPFDEITPRNCMPSLHTAWAVCLFIHSRDGSRPMRLAGTFWLIGTLGATLGFGYHYGADLVAGVVFVLTIDAAMRATAHGWDRSGTRLVTYGATVFTALLLSYRYLPTQMAELPWCFGPLMILAMASVIYGYVRTTRAWARKPTPIPPPEPTPAGPQAELV
ncbi:phosphatase PAP2 family protein [Streptomyces sp. 15-116A]|uniref:phosphatase PAP2 family protein n=1 Tax=Streptomyces sp. 15-116A TaxID=2259035 RepID=UPI0021B1E987|nr:phosphatase PAP2 family protein [Streptomyces sp. 15-116A]MCT7353210.1 phosphatase PAP2 family protein [Streptomyces sp. 15-116A]